MVDPQPADAAPALVVGALVTALYTDGRAYRACVTHSVTPHVIIKHVDQVGGLVVDPPRTTRLFHIAELFSIMVDANGVPIARLEQGWAALEVMHHAA